MSQSPHAAYYPDRAAQLRTSVERNVEVARDTYRLRFAAPAIAAKILPGQFLMVRIAGCDDPLLGRPFALYDVIVGDAGTPLWIDIVYLVLGKMTRRLSALTVGAGLDIWGPLGNGFAPPKAKHLVMAAGGIGQTPFLALAQESLGQRAYGQRYSQSALRERCEKVTLCYGARSAELLAGVADFQKAGVEVRLATDDGTAGRQGLVTDLLRETLDQVAEGQSVELACCGPERMMEAVSRLAAERKLYCQASLETPMSCGVGICFSCVAKIRDQPGGAGGGEATDWDYKRTCVEGPVFDSTRVVW